MLTTLRREDQMQRPGLSNDVNIEWCPHVTVDLSYWHGGRKLESIEAFEWHGETVLAPAIEHARRKCDFYGIDSSSTLEVRAYRSDWHVAKVRHSQDQHLASPDSDSGKVLLSHHPVWSSKHGHLTKPDTWPQFLATFIKFISVSSQLGADARWDLLVAASVGSPAPVLEQQGIAVVDARIREQTVVYRGLNERSPGCHLLKIEGSIMLAKSPLIASADHLVMEAAVNDGLGVKISLVDPAVAFDTLDTTLRMAAWEIEGGKITEKT